MTFCLYVCMYVCMSKWGFNWNTLCMLWKMSDYIGTGILEVCECPESVADWWIGFGRVIWGKNRAKLNWNLNPGSRRGTREGRRPLHWLGESWEFKTVFSSIGTRILKVCEYPESVTKQWNGFGRVVVCIYTCTYTRMQSCSHSHTLTQAHTLPNPFHCSMTQFANSIQNSKHSVPITDVYWLH